MNLKKSEKKTKKNRNRENECIENFLENIIKTKDLKLKKEREKEG